MRKFAAMIILLFYLAACIYVIASFSAGLSEQHPAVQLFFYVIAGLIWIAPLRYLFAWMNKGDNSSEV